ncbi:MAG: hypothetical protein WC509_02445 [Candidatus Izemoplasmatales bacterium]
MDKKKFAYGWLLKWILAAILIAVGILVMFQSQIVYIITGIAITIFSLFRVYPLMKTLKKEVLRTINLFEIVFDTIMGILMILAVALWWPAPGAESGNFWYESYGYFVAGFLYLRAFIYFISMYFFGEKSEPAKFWAHLICMTLAPAILVLEILNDAGILGVITWVLLIISVIGGLYLAYDGYNGGGGYRIYRQNSKSLQEQKAKKAPVEKEVPKPQPQPEEAPKETYIN